MRAAVSPKEERRDEEGGSGKGDEARGREPTGCQEKEKRTEHKDGECGTMPRPCENGVLMDPTQMASIGHVAK